MAETILDVRERPPAKRHAAVFEAFDTLEPGETLTVVNDHDPSPLLHQLEDENASFDAERSSVERAGADRFEANLRKAADGSTHEDESTVVDAALDALGSVTDPDLGMNVVDAGLIKSIEETSETRSSEEVTVELESTGVEEATLDDLESDIRAAIRRDTPVDEVVLRRTGGLGGPTVSVEDVRDRLADVDHPDRTVDVVEAGVVTDIEVEDRTVTLSVKDPALAGDLDDYRGEFLELLGEAAYNAHGVAEVRIATNEAVVPIEPPQAEDPPLADKPTAGGPPGAEAPSPLEHDPNHEAAAPPAIDLAGIDDIVLVASAKGGVGKTTVATQLARGLAAIDQSVGLLDADFTGPDVPQLLGIEPRIREGSIIEPVTQNGLDVMSVGLMENRPTAWNGEMIHNALVNLLGDVDWDVDTLVVDLPPGASDTLMTFLQFVPIDGVVLVTTPYPTSITDTNEGATLFREGDVPVLGAVVNMVRFACPSCGDEHDLFPGSDLETALDDPVLAELPFSPELRSFSGAPPRRLAELAETVAETVPGDEDLTVPDDAIDVRGMPDHGRVETVRDAFIGLASDEPLTVVSDHHPAGLAVALVDVLDVEASPSEVFETYDVTAHDADEWVLRIGQPTDATRPSA